MSFRTVYGYSRSENGWRMCNRDECVLVPGPFMATAPLRRGPAEILLGDFVRRHHVEVKAITSSVWGWSQYNDVGNSNHLAGTSVDVLAPERPWGQRVMSSLLVARTNTLVDSYGGAIYWGRRWNKPDEMHFQLGWPEGDSRYDAVIARVLGGGQPAPLPGQPAEPVTTLLRYGSSGVAVLHLQQGLNKVFTGRLYPMLPLAEDGDFGPNTLSAVIEFQRRSQLLSDGDVGPLTWAALAQYKIVP